MKKGQVIKVVVFVVIFGILLTGITNILRPKWITGTSVTFVQDQMYEQKENTVDVLVLGSSQLVYGMSSMRLLDEYGISAYSCATGEQPVLCGYFYLREMAKRHDIKTVIYDMSMLYEEEQEARFRKTLDSAPVSLNKLQTIQEHCKSENSDSIASYLFPISKYHSRWNELGRKDYDYENLNTEVFKGNIMSAEVSNRVAYDKVCVDYDEFDETVALDMAELKYFRQMAEYCKENNIDLILIKTPKLTWNKTCMEGIQELADECNLPYLDFNTSELLEEAEIDVKTDFWNSDHLNIRGAEKITDYMAEYLLERNQYADGRNTEAYDEEEVAAYRIDRENKYVQTSYDPQELLELLDNERYELRVYVSEDVSGSEYWTTQMQECWSALSGRTVYPEEQDGIDYNCKGFNISVYDKQTQDRIDSFTIYESAKNKNISVYRNKK